jgi:hypothetical protein
LVIKKKSVTTHGNMNVKSVEVFLRVLQFSHVSTIPSVQHNDFCLKIAVTKLTSV